jgi:hypothetical protein
MEGYVEIELARERVHSRQQDWRATAVALIGRLTVLAGAVWAVAQPYRITFLDGQGHDLWDHLAQPPPLVVAVGVLFELAVARPLVRELRGDA